MKPDLLRLQQAKEHGLSTFTNQCYEEEHDGLSAVCTYNVNSRLQPST
ncbi:hypothetical protein L917_11649 [Phytophthora nicotianae]|uniref:Uncharacterized protein n=1 Tax=Phytophthora nicotianae TaxID=4792 RepID=W2KWD2_PHYNI|nr:hypothetical protein L917_11649 [Phytophthora nicotianae]